MGTYNIPRNTKGEGRLFYIFSTKALIYTVVGIIVGAIIKFLIGLLGKFIPSLNGIISLIGVIIMILLGIIGFIIGTFNVPRSDRFEITKKTGGMKIDKVLFDSIKFHFKKRKYYIYDTKELVKEEVVREEKERKEQSEKEEKMRIEREENMLKNRKGYIRNER